MSYFFRQRQLQQERERLEKRGLNAVMNTIANKMSGIHALGWREEDHPRGKTTAESTAGSFAPKGGTVERTRGGRKITEAVLEDLKEVQRVGYRKLHQSELRTQEAFHKWAQLRMRDLMGPGYEDLVTEMVHRIWHEFSSNKTHTYRGPTSWSETAWAVKNDLVL